MAEQPSDDVLIKAATVALEDGADVVFDDHPVIDATPQGGVWVAAWVWVSNDHAASAAQSLLEDA